MWLKYAEQIQESPAELMAWEHRLRGQRVADRVRMLRLRLLGYCERQLQRWWRCYQQEGLAALVRERPRGGRREQMTSQAWQCLTTVLEAGPIGELRGVQRYLRTRCGIRYRSLSGVSRLLKRQGVKLKTGRRRHRKASGEQQAAFKKGLWDYAGDAGSPAGLCPG